MVKTAIVIRWGQLYLDMVITPDGLIITLLHFGDRLSPSLIVHGHESNVEVVSVIEYTE